MKKLHGIKNLLPYIARRKWQAIFTLLLALVSAGLSLLPIQIVAAIVDLIATGQCGWTPLFGDSLTTYLALFGVSYALNHVVANCYGYLTSMLAFHTIEDLRSDAMKWTLYSFKPYKEERKEGDVVSRISGDVEAVVRAVTGPLNGFLPMILKMIGSLVILFSWNAYIGLIAVALTVPLYFSSRWITGESKQIAARQRAANGEMIDAISDLLYGIPVIKAWQAERYEELHFSQYSHSLFSLSKKLQDKYFLYWLLINGLETVGMIAAVCLAASSAAAGTITAGSITVAFSYMSKVVAPAVSLSRYGNDLAQADVSLTRVFALRPEEERAVPALRPISAPPEIEFSDVTIPCNASKVLRSLTFTAHPNQILALVGPSGAGKSTILYTLMGFQKPSDGKIIINGQDATACIQDITAYASVSFQQPYLLNRSLRENVAYSDPQPQDERIKAHMDTVGLDEIREKRSLEEGVGSKGKKLSGGEQRRLALARALYQDRPIYLLDEPTAELDEASRIRVIQALSSLKKSATIILSTHDDDLIAASDQIVRIQPTDPQ